METSAESANAKAIANSADLVGGSARLLTRPVGRAALTDARKAEEQTVAVRVDSRRSQSTTVREFLCALALNVSRRSAEQLRRHTCLGSDGCVHVIGAKQKASGSI